MAYHERDPLLELLQQERAQLLEDIANAEVVGKRALRHVAARLQAIAAAEEELLYPALARVSLRPETQRFLDDCRGDGAAQQEALRTLARTKRSHPLWKIRALQLRELIQTHAERRDLRLVPVLLSQLPRALYRSLANTFGARCAQYLRQLAPRSTAPHCDASA